MPEVKKTPRKKVSALGRSTIGKEREYFVENLSMLVASGMSITSALHGLEEDVRSRALKKIIYQLRDDIENGSPLWKSLEATKLFPDYTVSLIRVGEESGRLSENLRLVAEQEAKDRILKSKISSAMMYPVLVLSLTVLIGTGISWFILPRLSTVFDSLQLDLPLVTQLLIRAGNFLGVHGSTVIPAILFSLLLVGYLVFYYRRTKVIGEYIMFAFPGVKQLLREVELSRFGYLLGTLLEAGLPVTQALESIENATVFSRYKKLYGYLRQSIADGNSFEKSLEEYKGARRLISTPVQQLIISGEQSGTLSQTLLRISESYEQKTENTTKNLSVILEPIMLVIVWGGVVAVALAVILPIYNLIGGLNAGGQPPPPPAPISAPEENVRGESSPVTKESTTESGRLVVAEGIDFLNVRDDADTEADVIGRVYPKEEFEFIYESDGWYEIILTGDQSGWVYGEYVLVE